MSLFSLLAVVILVNFIQHGLSDSPHIDLSYFDDRERPKGTLDKEGRNWRYTQRPNGLTNEVRYFAATTSENMVYMDFPHDGGSNFRLLLIHSQGKTKVALGASRGIFHIPRDTAKIKVKFDSQPIETYKIEPTAKERPDAVYIHPSDDFINALKNAEDLRIEGVFHRDKRAIVRFDVRGLRWDKFE